MEKVNLGRVFSVSDETQNRQIKLAQIFVVTIFSLFLLMANKIQQSQKTRDRLSHTYLN